MKQAYIEGSNCCEDFEWDDICYDLTQAIEKINPKGGWHCEVRNFGWQKRDGHKDFNAQDGRTLLSAILPNTECNFKIYKSRNKIEINNAHHDAPTWDEWYTLTKNNRRSA